mmetsp:Transcript_16544/g.38890  ORF Transcript_16544/g.38890 Transcript_16544/m.38890 type:complete len:132 (-) Transcript_16544:571-966(-)
MSTSIYNVAAETATAPLAARLRPVGAMSHAACAVAVGTTLFVCGTSGHNVRATASPDTLLFLHEWDQVATIGRVRNASTAPGLGAVDLLLVASGSDSESSRVGLCSVPEQPIAVVCMCCLAPLGQPRGSSG